MRDQVPSKELCCAPVGKYKRRTVIRNRLARARRLAAQHQRKTRQPAGWQQHMQAAAAGQAVRSAAPPGRKQTLYNSFPEQLLAFSFRVLCHCRGAVGAVHGLCAEAALDLAV